MAIIWDVWEHISIQSAFVVTLVVTQSRSMRYLFYGILSYAHIHTHEYKHKFTNMYLSNAHAMRVQLILWERVEMLIDWDVNSSYCHNIWRENG